MNKNTNLIVLHFVIEGYLPAKLSIGCVFLTLIRAITRNLAIEISSAELYDMKEKRESVWSLSGHLRKIKIKNNRNKTAWNRNKNPKHIIRIIQVLKCRYIYSLCGQLLKASTEHR